MSLMTVADFGHKRLPMIVELIHRDPNFDKGTGRVDSRFVLCVQTAPRPFPCHSNFQLAQERKHFANLGQTAVWDRARRMHARARCVCAAEVPRMMSVLR